MLCILGENADAKHVEIFLMRIVVNGYKERSVPPFLRFAAVAGTLAHPKQPSVLLTRVAKQCVRAGVAFHARPHATKAATARQRRLATFVERQTGLRKAMEAAGTTPGGVSVKVTAAVAEGIRH